MRLSISVRGAQIIYCQYCYAYQHLFMVAGLFVAQPTLQTALWTYLKNRQIFLT
jgi:hypothetical protein